MMLATFRPADAIVSNHPLRGLKRELQSRGQCEELALGALSRADVTEYVAARFPVPDSAAVGRLLHQTTDGNPLFMVNVLDYWQSLGVLTASGGLWRLNPDAAGGSFAVPESLRQMIERLLERLTHPERRALEAASIAGREFATDTVAAALGEEPAAVEEWCEGLAERGQFLRAQGSEVRTDATVAGRYAFTHAFYQQVLYEGMAAVRRVRLHRQMGQWLEAARGRTSDIAAELAVHFERGQAYLQAVQYWSQAADNAGRLHAPREAAALLEKAIGLIEHLPDTPERAQQELALLIAMGVPLLMTRGYGAPEVERTYARARQLCEQLGESPQMIPALAGLFKFYFVRARYRTSRELGERVMRLAEHTSDRFVTLAAHSLIGVSLLNLGDLTAARSHLEQGVALYDLQLHRPLALLYGDDPGVVCHSFAALTLWFLGFPDQALRRSEESLALARELSVPYSLAFALSFCAWIRVRRREAAAARVHLEGLQTLAAEHGFSFFLAEGTILDGWARAELEPGPDGIAQIRPGLADYQATGAEMGRPSHLGLLAEACAAAGDFQDGMAAVAEALELVERTGERSYEAELNRLQGELILTAAMGSPSRSGTSSGAKARARRSGPGLKKSAAPDAQAQARECFRRAIEVARRQQALMLELRAVMSLVRAAPDSNSRSADREALVQVLARFSEGLGTAELKAARALLDGSGAQAKLR
jgi:predicted ATPase